MKLVSRVASLVHAAALVYLVATHQLFSPAPLVIAVQVMAVALAPWAWFAFPRGQFSTQPEPRRAHLIEAGPYRWIRHPMYTSVEALVWSGVLSHLSPLTFAIGAACTTAVVVRIADEEKLLRERIPGYAEYAARTKRFVPFVF